MQLLFECNKLSILGLLYFNAVLCFRCYDRVFQEWGKSGARVLSRGTTICPPPPFWLGHANCLASSLIRLYSITMEVEISTSIQSMALQTVHCSHRLILLLNLTCFLHGGDTYIINFTLNSYHSLL